MCNSYKHMTNERSMLQYGFLQVSTEATLKGDTKHCSAAEMCPRFCPVFGHAAHQLHVGLIDELIMSHDISGNLLKARSNTTLHSRWHAADTSVCCLQSGVVATQLHLLDYPSFGDDLWSPYERMWMGPQEFNGVCGGLHVSSWLVVDEHQHAWGNASDSRIG